MLLGIGLSVALVESHCADQVVADEDIVGWQEKWKARLWFETCSEDNLVGVW